MKKLIVLMFTVFLLMGCGGDSGGSTGGGGNNNGGDNGTSGDVSVSGTVIHSVYSAADIVCYDRNNNKKCDSSEPFTRIGSDGAYTLSGSEADAVSVPIVAELANATAGTSSLAAVSGSRLVFDAPAGQRTISSLSTVVKAMLDNDPSLSFDDAHAAVQADLGTSEDLFRASSAVATLAAKITAAVIAMFDDLSTRFGITISDKVIMLVINEIIPQLTDIVVNNKVPADVVGDTIGGMGETDVKDKMDDLANSMPTVMSISEVMNQGMYMYQFHTGSNASSIYEFTLFVFSNTALKFGERTSYSLPLPTVLTRLDADWKASKNSDGSVTFGDDTRVAQIASLDVIPIDGKSLTPNPAHPQTTINFSAGALMYKLNNYYYPTLPSIEEIQRNLTSNTSTSYSTAAAKLSGNIIETRRNDESFHIILNSDGTFRASAQNDAAKYDWHDAFGPKNNPPKGTYEKTKDSNGDDLYTFYVDGRKVFVMLNVRGSSNSLGTSNYIAGKFSSAGLDPKVLFNKIAAEDIQNQW